MVNKCRKIVYKSMIFSIVLLLTLQGFMYDINSVQAATEGSLIETSSKSLEDLESAEIVLYDEEENSPLNINVLNESSRWIYRYIDGDLYIGPKAVLEINGNVTVTGNIYVLGALISYGTFNVNGTIFGRNFFQGNATPPPLYNGTVQILGGENNIRGRSASSRPLQDIPLELRTDPIKSENGVIQNIKGATVPVVDMYVEDQRIQLQENGIFETGAIELGNKDTVTFTFKDVFGQTITKRYSVDLIDTIPPTVATDTQGGYYGNPKTVTLTISEAGTIYYTLDGSEPTTSSSKYASPIEIKEDTVLKYFAVDKADNKSEIATKKFIFFTIDTITDKSNAVSGKAKPRSLITVRVNEQTWTGTAGEDGTYKIEIPIQQANSIVKVSAKTESGIQSETIELRVKDITPPAKPKVNEITDQTTEVTGTAEAGSTVSVKAGEKEIGTAQADTNGTFKVIIKTQTANTELFITATDEAGNESEATKKVVKDVTPPAKPEVNTVTDLSQEITGSAEAGSTVIIKAENKEIGRADSKEDGTFNVRIAKQEIGVKLDITATDKAGNVSEPTIITVIDGAPPVKPEVNEVTDQSNKITGTAEAGSIVIVKDGNKEIGKAKASEDGTFSINIASQKAGTELLVTATNDFGKVSEPAKVTVKDLTPPERPFVEDINDLSTEVKGTAEAGSTVIIKVGNKEIGRDKTSADGTFKVKIPKQEIHLRLTITATDQAGNVSGETHLTVQHRIAVEKAISRLGQIKVGESYIYQGPYGTADKISSEQYKNVVYYIKRQAEHNNQLYYLLSTSPNATKGTIGWMKASDVTSYSHVAVDNKSKTFYITGKSGLGYNRAWGGRNNIVYADLKSLKNSEFKVHKTEKVGNNTWYRGILNGKQTWIHSSHLSGPITNYKEQSTSRLGQIKAGNSYIYEEPYITSDRIPADIYRNVVYYIKKQATYNGELFYLLGNSPSDTKNTIGWMRASDVTSYKHVGVDNKAKTFYVSGKSGVGYIRPWGGSKNLNFTDLKPLKNAVFKVHMTQKVGNNIWYRGDLNGKRTWIHSHHLSTTLVDYKEQSTSRLGQIKAGKSDIYKNPYDTVGKKSSDAYKNVVYYIKKQATYNGELFYLLSNSPSATKNTIGWMRASDVTTYTHAGVDKKAKTFYVSGKSGVGYSRPWGGSKNLNFTDLKPLKNAVFKVHMTQKVGNNIWYRGDLNGKRTWIHSYHLSTTLADYEEESTSRLGRIKAGKSDIYTKPHSSAGKKSSDAYKNRVYYIKKEATFQGEKYYLLSNQPSATSGTIGWMKASDVTSYPHVALDNVAKTFYVTGKSGVGYDRAWGSGKNIVYPDLKDLKNAVFNVHKTERVGNNTWYRGELNGKRTWIHSSHLDARLDSTELSVVNLVNVERQKYNLPALYVDLSLSMVAREKSNEMQTAGYFDHTSPTYGSPFKMMDDFKIQYMSAGENIAKGYLTPESVVQAWMDSPGHRANILNEGFTHIGVGHILRNSAHYWTQHFIGN